MIFTYMDANMQPVTLCARTHTIPVPYSPPMYEVRIQESLSGRTFYGVDTSENTAYSEARGAAMRYLHKTAYLCRELQSLSATSDTHLGTSFLGTAFDVLYDTPDLTL